MKRKPIFFMMPYILGTPKKPYSKSKKKYKKKELPELGAKNGPEIILNYNQFALKCPHPMNPPPKYLGEEYYKEKLEGKNPTLNRIGKFYEIVTEEIFETMNSLKQDQYNLVQIILGGDHSTASPGLAALLRRENPKDVGLIMMDSHGDLHNTKTSPNGNFHGMWLRSHLGKFEIKSIEKYTNRKLPKTNLLYIGNLVLESSEKRYLKRNKIQVIRRKDFLQDKEQTQKRIEEFTKKFKHIHLSFDIDVVDKSHAPGTGLPSEDGLFHEEYLPVLEIVKKVKSISMDLCELYPELDFKNNQTVKLAQGVLKKILFD